MEHRSLLGDISRFAEGVTEGPMQIQEAGSVRSNGDFFHQSQPYRRHARLASISLAKQSHGPCADGSGGHQKNQIDQCALLLPPTTKRPVQFHDRDELISLVLRESQFGVE